MALAATATLTSANSDLTALLHHESITCPYCWETIEIALDLSIDEQQYVEDCSVCCRPIVIAYRAEDGTLAELAVTAETGE
jgi:hypothetical protein